MDTMSEYNEVEIEAAYTDNTPIEEDADKACYKCATSSTDVAAVAADLSDTGISGIIPRMDVYITNWDDNYSGKYLKPKRPIFVNSGSANNVSGYYITAFAPIQDVTTGVSMAPSGEIPYTLRIGGTGASAGEAASHTF